VLNFAVIDLSSLFIDVARDRLYCGGANSRERRSAQTALYNVLDALVRILAVLIPFTADEVYSHMPGEKLASVHLLTLAPPHPEWADEQLLARWERLLDIRSEALKLLETMRQAGTIGAPLEAAVRINWGQPTESGNADGADAPFAVKDATLLKELFVVSDVKVMSDDEAAPRWQHDNDEDLKSQGEYIHEGARMPLLLIGARAGGKKCPRCWIYFDDDSGSELDLRCRAVVSAPA
jgi:isoleucyl-tRNA synthetase